jgi:hypothetical protein
VVEVREAAGGLGSPSAWVPEPFITASDCSGSACVVAFSEDDRAVVLLGFSLLVALAAAGLVVQFGRE